MESGNPEEASSEPKRRKRKKHVRFAILPADSVPEKRLANPVGADAIVDGPRVRKPSRAKREAQEAASEASKGGNGKRG